MFNLLRNPQSAPLELLSSKLFDQVTFYPAFVNDLQRCRSQVIIESPFITSSRVAMLLPALQKLRQRGVQIAINTRQPQEHDLPWAIQAEKAIRQLQDIGIQVLYTGGHHRKLAILDSSILWEGSLNILSQNESCEVMRRIRSDEIARQMIAFTKVDRFLS
jgi:biotin operon repressor